MPECCARNLRECIAKTNLVEQFLVPLLQHHAVPGGILVEFKRRWRAASLLGKDIQALRAIAHRYHLPLPSDATEDQLRQSIIEAEAQ